MATPRPSLAVGGLQKRKARDIAQSPPNSADAGITGGWRKAGGGSLAGAASVRGPASVRPRTAASDRRAAGRATGPKIRIRHVKNGAGIPKAARDLCNCCFGFKDGALSRPVYNSSASPYAAPADPSKMFSRGAGGALRAGKAKGVFKYRAGALHHTEVPVQRKKPYERAATPAWSGGGKGGQLFEPEVKSLGPADKAEPQRKPSSLKAGSYVAKPLPPPAPMKATKAMIAPPPVPRRGDMAGAPGARAKWVQGGKGALDIVKEGPAGMPVHKAFKSGKAKGDFFDAALLDTTPAAEPDKPARSPAGKPWAPAGKGGKPFQRPPKAMPDPYGMPQPPGAESRQRGMFGICCIPRQSSDTSRPVVWVKTRTGDVHRTRDLKSAAQISGMPEATLLRQVNITRETHPGDTAVTFDWTT